MKNLNATKLLVTVVGIILAMTAIIHGIMEISRGNTPTGGNLLKEIGAFTLIQNYLATGICTVLLGTFIIVWTPGYIATKHGASIFLVLYVMLFLTGGGFAQVLVFLITWALATRINKPLQWWRKILPENLRKKLSRMWPACFITCMSLFGTGIAIWLSWFITGGRAQNMVNYTCWGFLCGGLVFFVLTVIAGFAHDIERRDKPQSTGNDPRISKVL